MPTSMKFLPFLLLLTASFLASATAFAQSAVMKTPPTMTLYIGTYSNDPKSGILRAELDPATGIISTPTIAAATPNPSFLALSPDGKRLLAANESGTVAGQNGGGLSSFSVGAGGVLSPLSSVALAGGPCHVEFDKSGNFAFAATYGAGTVAAYAMNASGEFKRTALFQHEGKSVHSRQRGPHAHQALVSPDNKLALVADLGLDKVLIYRLGKDGSLTPNEIPFVQLPLGSGPRHFAWTPDSKTLYVGGELDNTVSAFRFHAATGATELLQTLTTLPADFKDGSSLAEVTVHPNGKWLFVSNRGHDSIATFAIGKGGQLTSSGFTSTEGKNPRHFAISPDGAWLLAANADSRSVAVFKVDTTNGALHKTSMLSGLADQPVCLLFGPTE